MLKGKGKNLMMAFICATAIIAVMVIGYLLVSQPTLNRIFQMFGGNMPSGIIQYFTYIAFFLGFFEIRSRNKRLEIEEESLHAGMLPEQEQWVFSPQDVNELKLQMIKYEQGQNLLLVDIIKKAATKFRANRSISDVMDIVTNQVKINMTKAESKQSIIRYLVWAIPSIGFIGTILGIAQSLGLADQANDPEKLAEVTSYMYVAFDTTLVALLLSIVLMWFFHALQEREDELHTDMEEYLIENLVNRIHPE